MKNCFHALYFDRILFLHRSFPPLDLPRGMFILSLSKRKYPRQNKTAQEMKKPGVCFTRPSCSWVKTVHGNMVDTPSETGENGFLPFPPAPVAKGFLVRSGTFRQLPLSVLAFVGFRPASCSTDTELAAYTCRVQQLRRRITKSRSSRSSSAT